MGCQNSKENRQHASASTKGRSITIVNSNSEAQSSALAKVSKDYDALFKILLIGDAGVGKTSLVTQWVDNLFSDNYLATIGIDFKLKQMEIGGKRVKVQLWDTAGQERYNTITQSYYRGVHGVVVTFDVCERQSFENVKKWLKDIEEYTGSNKRKVNRLLVGNKCDLLDKRTVSLNDANAFAKSCQMNYFDVSAKSGLGVDEALSSIIREILDSHTT